MDQDRCGAAGGGLGLQFQHALEAVPAGMILVDSRGRLRFVNVQVERLLGYDRAELLGQPVELLVPLGSRDQHPAFRQGYAEHPVARPMGGGRDLAARHKDGSEVPVEIGLNPIVEAGETLVLCSVVDITERQRARRDLERQRDDLDRTSREREVLLKEVHHRVKNNLQLISSLLNLQADRAPDEATRAVLGESRSRVHAIALAHEQLYRHADLARVAFHDYLCQLVDHLATAFSPPGCAVEVRVRASQVYLPVDVAIPCGLIVNELVSNAFKHAFRGRPSGTLTVDLELIQGSGTRLTVADSGVGLAPGVDPERNASLGLELVSRLAEQVDATLTVERGHGTAFVLLVPNGGDS